MYYVQLEVRTQKNLGAKELFVSGELPSSKIRPPVSTPSMGPRVNLSPIVQICWSEIGKRPQQLISTNYTWLFW
jgi:hypothetical protein